MTALCETARLPDVLSGRLAVPLIVAPMGGVSGIKLVTTVCRTGSIGAFPTTNARSAEELHHWLGQIEHDLADLDRPVAPHCPTLMVRHGRFREDLACLLRHKIEMAITSVGPPTAAVDALHDIGCLVFADIASLQHAEKAIKAGADGLILLAAGAGGHTGWANPFAFVRSVRAMFEGPVVLAGGITDGISLAAARILGCDLGCMGTRFIATWESMASADYRRMLLNSTLDDIVLTSAFWGLNANVLRGSILAAGLDIAKLDESVSEIRGNQRLMNSGEGSPRWDNIWCAGHSVSGIRSVTGAAQLVEEIAEEYKAALANAACTRVRGD